MATPSFQWLRLRSGAVNVVDSVSDSFIEKMALVLLNETANRIIDACISSQLAMMERFRTTGKAEKLRSLLHPFDIPYQ